VRGGVPMWHKPCWRECSVCPSIQRGGCGRAQGQPGGPIPVRTVDPQPNITQCVILPCTGVTIRSSPPPQEGRAAGTISIDAYAALPRDDSMQGGVPGRAQLFQNPRRAGYAHVRGRATVRQARVEQHVCSAPAGGGSRPGPPEPAVFCRKGARRSQMGAALICSVVHAGRLCSAA